MGRFHSNSFFWGIFSGIIGILAGMILEVKEVEVYSSFVTSNIIAISIAYALFISYALFSGIKIKEIESSSDAPILSRVKGFIVGAPAGSILILYAIQAGL